MFKSIDKWLLPLVLKGKWKPPKQYHVLLSVCDHFEPFHQTNGDKNVAISKMNRWLNVFPEIQSNIRDSGGNPPVHTYFYPIEQYDHDIVSILAQLCVSGGGETEVHLHHRDDTQTNLTEQLNKGKELLSNHSLLSFNRDGDIGYGFIHGNWAICNSHPKHMHCGVSNEISVLKSTGCYADFTMPSIPDPCQSRIVNSIYYSYDKKPTRSHDYGRLAAIGMEVNSNELLFIQGPIGLNWKQRKRFILPRIENSDLTFRNPPTLDRFELWVKSGISVVGRPEWIFVKLHTHGCNPQNIEMHLGGVLNKFYTDLTDYCSKNEDISLHFVTARQMANIVHAAVDGKDGNPYHYKDYLYTTRF